MQVTTTGGSDGRGPKKPSYSGFWMWTKEMDRLDLWPRMDDAFQGRALERSSDEATGRVGGGSARGGLAAELIEGLEEALQHARHGGTKQ